MSEEMPPMFKRLVAEREAKKRSAMPDMDSVEYWGERHDNLLKRFNALNQTALALRGEVRSLNFRISTLEQATGADGARVIADLRMKVARREEGLRTLVKHFEGKAPYTAPELMGRLCDTFIGEVINMAREWEDECAAAAEVSGNEAGPASTQAG